MTTLELLLKLEWWKEPDWCYARCLDCGGLQQYGHQDECEVASAIERELAALPPERRPAWRRNPRWEDLLHPVSS